MGVGPDRRAGRAAVPARGWHRRGRPPGRGIVAAARHGIEHAARDGGFDSLRPTSNMHQAFEDNEFFVDNGKGHTEDENSREKKPFPILKRSSMGGNAALFSKFTTQIG